MVLSSAADSTITRFLLMLPPPTELGLRRPLCSPSARRAREEAGPCSGCPRVTFIVTHLRKGPQERGRRLDLPLSGTSTPPPICQPHPASRLRRHLSGDLKQDQLALDLFHRLTKALG